MLLKANFFVCAHVKYYINMQHVKNIYRYSHPHSFEQTKQVRDKTQRAAVRMEQSIYVLLLPSQLSISPSCAPSWKILQSPF